MCLNFIFCPNVILIAYAYKDRSNFTCNPSPHQSSKTSLENDGQAVTAELFVFLRVWISDLSRILLILNRSATSFSVWLTIQIVIFEFLIDLLIGIKYRSYFGSWWQFRLSFLIFFGGSKIALQAHAHFEILYRKVPFYLRVRQCVRIS